MSIFLATILAISANPSESTQATAAPAAQAVAPAARSGRELSDAAHAALQRWAKATDKELEAAARDLLGIYQEIQKDTHMARSERETLRITVRGRLDRLSTQISKQIAKDKSGAKAASSVTSVAANPNQPQGAVLAGIGLPAGGGAGLNGGAGIGGGAAGGQNTKADDGQLLVDLIQNTISPKSWEVNGGACTIYYWQPQHAIVVHATGDVQDNIADTLEQLNRAGH
jgi:hypothetical protein